jgi:predicted nucleotidyltransferase
MEPARREAVVTTLAEQLAGRTDIAFACLFGSFLSAGGFRDVDLAIWTTPEAAATVDLDLAVHLSRHLGLPVDVRRVNDAPVTFLFHALRGRVVAARDQHLLADVMERTARRYHDLAPRLRRATREAFAP